ncbi:MAG: hypothetical protein PWP51_2767 [Clostridiales bacterium]|jgi:hypothetical protein|nr:hypothetical protein [Clostridiales bacterium]
MGFIFKPDDQNGQYGKRLFIASFQDVPNDQLDKIEFELNAVSKDYEAECVII